VTEPTAYALERLRCALQQAPVAELAIEVTIDCEGRLHLAGPLSSEAQRAAVLDLAHAEQPDRAVVDAMVVPHRPPDPSIELVT
jgi:hypothetical protein